MDGGALQLLEVVLFNLRQFHTTFITARTIKDISDASEDASLLNEYYNRYDIRSP